MGSASGLWFVCGVGGRVSKVSVRVEEDTNSHVGKLLLSSLAMHISVFVWCAMLKYSTWKQHNQHTHPLPRKQTLFVICLIFWCLYQRYRHQQKTKTTTTRWRCTHFGISRQQQRRATPCHGRVVLMRFGCYYCASWSIMASIFLLGNYQCLCRCACACSYALVCACVCIVCAYQWLLVTHKYRHRLTVCIKVSAVGRLLELEYVGAAIHLQHTAAAVCAPFAPIWCDQDRTTANIPAELVSNDHTQRS